MKKISMSSRPVKYYMAKRKGLSKRKSAEVAGYYPTNITKIENSAIYKEVEKQFSYKDELEKKITLNTLADEQLKIVLQDRDLSTKQRAIEQVQKTLEPEHNETYEEQVVIVVG